MPMGIHAFSDADLSTPTDELRKLLTALHEPCDIAIASRALPRSRVEVHQPWYRESMGRLFNVPVQLLAVPGNQDTRCGFKCFTREAARSIYPRMTCNRFGFDFEMFYTARLLAHRIREVPVVWRNSPEARVRALRDCVAMIGDLLRIRWNDLCGWYDRSPLSLGLAPVDLATRFSCAGPKGCFQFLRQLWDHGCCQKAS